MTEWRPVVGYEGRYEVSDDGQVRSLARVVMRSTGAAQTVRARLLKPHPDRRGYWQVSLTTRHRSVHRRIHRLMLEAFVGPCPPGEEGLHGDGDMFNNTISNLRWGTRRENVHDSMKHGTLPVGERAAASKRTEREVLDIRSAHESGASMSALARQYGMALASIQAIVKGRSWKHVA